MRVTTSSTTEFGSVATLTPVSRFRTKRFARLLALIDRVIAKKGAAHILDLGGTCGYWLTLEPLWRGRDLHITLVNLEAEQVSDPRFTTLAGDACSLPEFADGQFDLVHSNSVIEHVGRWRQMRAMAREVMRLAPSFYVQTPAYGFPIEPHFRAPLFHWLPMPWRIWLCLNFSLGFYPKASSLDEAMHFVEDAILIDERQFRALFPPPAELVKERFLGLTKSFIAIKDGVDG